MTLSYDELEEFRRSLRRFVERELIPFERRVMTEAERRKAQDSAREAGFWLMDVPEALGGQGLGMRGMAVFWHEVSRTTALPARDHSLFGPVTGPILLSLGRKRSVISIRCSPDESGPVSLRPNPMPGQTPRRCAPVRGERATVTSSTGSNALSPMRMSLTSLRSLL